MGRFLGLAAAAGAVLGIVAVAQLWGGDAPAMASATVPTAEARLYGKIEPYRPRFGRRRPLILVVGENSGTELTDFVIPYGILQEAGVADVLTVAVRPGPIAMLPALKISPDMTIEDVDARYAEGADYVVVPAMERNEDPTLTSWIASQARKGATVVSICDGALVVANSGVLRGHRGTAHWATQSLREKKYADTIWVRNARYVADGRVVSSAGISAAIPTSLALVEAIAGHDKASALARQLSLESWSNAHDSEIFRPRLGRNILAFAGTMYTNGWLHRRERLGIPLKDGVDEIAVALTADAWSRTGRSQAYGIAATRSAVRSRHGLAIVPDRTPSGSPSLSGMLDLPPHAPGLMFDDVLASVRTRYGTRTAFGVALQFEYPWRPRATAS